jgi:hypothetical protein
MNPRREVAYRKKRKFCVSPLACKQGSEYTVCKYSRRPTGGAQREDRHVNRSLGRGRRHCRSQQGLSVAEGLPATGGKAVEKTDCKTKPILGGDRSVMKPASSIAKRSQFGCKVLLEKSLRSALAGAVLPARCASAAKLPAAKRSQFGHSAKMGIGREGCETELQNEANSGKARCPKSRWRCRSAVFARCKTKPILGEIEVL